MSPRSWNHQASSYLVCASAADAHTDAPEGVAVAAKPWSLQRHLRQPSATTGAATLNTVQNQAQC